MNHQRYHISLLLLCGLVFILECCSYKPQQNYTQFVNPFIGTDGTGHTFPGPSMPFGMVQPGPDNRDQGWDYTSGYQYRDSMILGFSQTRANGTGINEFGDILLQPFTHADNNNFACSYNKQTEKAAPGFYTVTLSNQVQVELTCTERVAFHRYTYPDTAKKLLVDFQHGLRFLTDSLVVSSSVTVEGNRVLSGYCRTRNWVERTYFFVLEFEEPFIYVDTLPLAAKQKAPRYILQFKPGTQPLQTKIALSTVSVEGARKNLQQELPHWNFGLVRSKADEAWNRYLGRVQIEAPLKEKQIFYSALYRLFLQPSNIADVDGRYRGPDDAVHTSPSRNRAYYSTFSLWDTYRAAHPLYTLLLPEKVDDFVLSMIQHSQQAGFLPIWTAWGQDNYCMIGNHAIPVIVDAYMKGFRGFDAEAALQEMIKSTSQNHINSNWSLLNQYGYYPFDSLRDEAVSRTLEHGVDDYCIAIMAKKMGKDSIATLYFKRASYYKNLYDTVTKQMRGKDSKGNWRTPFDPLNATSPMNNPGDYTEANAWQYFWTPAQYDVTGLQTLLGGTAAFEQQLDQFFTIQSPDPDKHLGQEALIGQYAHGNEPSHHVAYLYAFTNNPAKGQQIIKDICNRFYNNTPTGLIGNDDCGQMSAWYIFSMLGFYPVNPADASFVTGIPQINHATIQSGNKKITIRKSNNGQLLINGKQPSIPFFSFEFLYE
ncbi:MAG TPA: GH92 family glycosyl hydrolase [Lacibacter sp.]|nr:GH92 family glycosyl hydrolase [Lacibacter sp.]HMO89873.1 GH92 family glycosyl hydrolase [Lacibacter sp.]